jgi:hypothetical protein
MLHRVSSVQCLLADAYYKTSKHLEINWKPNTHLQSLEVNKELLLSVAYIMEGRTYIIFCSPMSCECYLSGFFYEGISLYPFPEIFTRQSLTCGEKIQRII